jgi:subtilase family serine protease
MSWGGPEFSGENAEDVHFRSASGVTFFASAGDSGHGVLYPAASWYVMSVGATKLNVDAVGNYQNEKAWRTTGGGASSQELEPGFQLSYPIPGNSLGGRGTPDVSYDGASDTGVAVYDGQPNGNSSGWMQVGGTSAGPPQWSGLIAIANALRQFLHKSVLTGSTVGDAALYDAAKVFPADAPYHDITNGSDGNCGTQCKAKPGWDYLTGLGSPRANLLVPTLVLQP